MYLDFDNVPFYIGKGSDTRYKVRNHLGNNHSNGLLKNKICKVGAKNVRIHFLHKDLTEKEAFRQERYWISYYGRRDLGIGTLCNLTDGGEGTSGRIHSVEARRKIGEWSRNFVRTEEHCAKISTAQKDKPRPWTAGKNHGMYGKHHTDEAKCKMGESRRGKAVGEVHHNAKLTEEDVLKIRELFILPNYDRRTSAKLFGVSPTVITNIVKRKTWIHI
ncbi:hypothetical protein LCGC14_1187090 [marine sediment metagenome]|uniref:GIY-YIG domain-containing protein n=1 Tax=marine sediment metagenome TaxID=412755 RepID=A0A0F9LQ98_9ZZZZ